MACYNYDSDKSEIDRLCSKYSNSKNDLFNRLRKEVVTFRYLMLSREHGLQLNTAQQIHFELKNILEKVKCTHDPIDFFMDWLNYADEVADNTEKGMHSERKN